MEYKNIRDFKIPVIGMGTWQLGGRNEPDYSKDDEIIAAIKSAIKLGYTLIDTAEMYGGGHTEELVAKAIEGFDRRKLFIISKVMSKHLSYDDLLKSARDSLERLNTDYFDLYLIHFPNSDIPIKDTMRAMDYLVEHKITKFIGVSNFSVEEMKEAQQCTKNKIVANQIQYSLITRNKSTYCVCTNMESEIIPYCQQNGIIIIADRPLHKGMLLQNKYPLLDDLSKKYEKTKSQIAINWLISKKNMITIPMSTNLIHLRENLESLGWTLSSDDIELLDNTIFESTDV